MHARKRGMNCRRRRQRVRQQHHESSRGRLRLLRGILSRQALRVTSTAAQATLRRESGRHKSRGGPEAELEDDLEKTPSKVGSMAKVIRMQRTASTKAETVDVTMAVDG